VSIVSSSASPGAQSGPGACPGCGGIRPSRSDRPRNAQFDQALARAWEGLLDEPCLKRPPRREPAPGAGGGSHAAPVAAARGSIARCVYAAQAGGQKGRARALGAGRVRAAPSPRRGSAGLSRGLESADRLRRTEGGCPVTIVAEPHEGHRMGRQSIFGSCPATFVGTGSVSG
jgi:hypothetical protein